MQSIGATTRSLPSLSTFATVPSSQPTSTSFGTYTEGSQSASTTSTDSSGFTFKTTQTDAEDISAQRRPRRKFYKMGRRSSGDIARDLSRLPSLLTAQGLKTVVQGIFRPGRESSSSGSNITLPLSRTGTVRDFDESQPVREFDMGALRRVRRQKDKYNQCNGIHTGEFEHIDAEASVCNQRAEAVSSSLTDDNDGAEETDSAGSDCSVYSCAAEGNEIEVNGGVALTEEAVETHTPDILAVDVVPPKGGSVVHVQVVDKDNRESDIGSQSIMTQV